MGNNDLPDRLEVNIELGGDGHPAILFVPEGIRFNSEERRLLKQAPQNLNLRGILYDRVKDLGLVVDGKEFREKYSFGGVQNFDAGYGDVNRLSIRSLVYQKSGCVSQ